MQVSTSFSPPRVRWRSLLPIATLAINLLLLAGCDNAAAPRDSFQVAARGVEVGTFAPRGEFAVVGSLHHGGSLWRIDDRERLYNWNHREGEQSTLTAVAYAPDGSWAATASGDTLALWNPASGAAERYWTTPGAIRALALNTSASRALAGLATNQAVVFNALNGGRVAQLNHGGPVVSAVLSKDGRFALTGSTDQYARWWDIASGQVIHRISHRDEVQLVALSPDETLALSVSKYDKARLWQVESGTVVGELALNAERLKRGLSVTAASINSDNSLLVTGRHDGVVQLWQLPGLSLIKQWQLPKKEGWQPTTPRVIALSFAELDTAEQPSLIAIASNGYVHHLHLAEQ